MAFVLMGKFGVAGRIHLISLTIVLPLIMRDLIFEKKGELPPNSFVQEIYSHEASLCGYLKSRFPWLPDVEEVAHEAVIRTWHWGAETNGEKVKSSKAVLYSIARNLAYDIGRRRKVAEINSIPDFEDLSVLDEETNVAETVSTRHELEILAEAIRQLPDGCRQILTLSKMYGYKPREIADQLGISVHTVRAQTAKGLKRCVHYLKKHGIDRHEKKEGR